MYKSYFDFLKQPVPDEKWKGATDIDTLFSKVNFTHAVYFTQIQQIFGNL